MERSALSIFKKAAVIILLFSILMRVIWVNLRDYDLEITPIAWTSLLLVQASDSQCSYQPPLQNLATGGGILSEVVANPINPSFVSPGFFYLAILACKEKGIDGQKIREWNQWAVVATAWVLVLLARILSKSWLFALMTGAVVLSRGAFIGRAGLIGFESILAFLFASSMLALAHFLRSGSRKMLILFGLAGLLGGLFDPVFLLLPFGFGVFILLSFSFHQYVSPSFRRYIQKKSKGQYGNARVRKDRKHLRNKPIFSKLLVWLDSIYAFTLGESILEVRSHRESRSSTVPVGHNFLGGSLFAPSDVKYSKVFESWGWLQIASVCFAVCVIGIVCLGSLYSHLIQDTSYVNALLTGLEVNRLGMNFPSLEQPFSAWQLALDFLDLHLLASLIMVALVIIQPKHTIMEANRPFNVFLLYLLLAIASYSSFRDGTSLSILQASISGQPVSSGGLSTIAWMEPTILALGVISLRVLLRSIRERLFY